MNFHTVFPQSSNLSFLDIITMEVYMPNTAFQEIWRRLVSHEGEIFHTITNKEFTYTIDGDGFYPSRTNYRLSKTDLETAYRKVPIDGPGVINQIVRGPAYIWAVLHDNRISRGEW